MNANRQQDRVQRFISKGGIIPYFFSNRKTQISVDFRICPLMKKNERGRYSSPVCPSCYSKTILCVYPDLRRKVENLPAQTKSTLKAFEESCRLLKEEFGWEKIRFYALSDFSPKDIPYIETAARYFTIDIISKTLVLPRNEKHLVRLFSVENVWVSLSFNKNNMRHLGRIKELIMVYEPKYVNLNYMLKYPEENPMSPELDIFSIIHLRNEKKRRVMAETGLEESRACGVLDINGNPVEGHGHCTSCNNCHTATIERLAVVA